MSAASPSLKLEFRIFAAVVLGSIFVALPASGESLWRQISEEDARSMSSALKTYICVDKRKAPTWCAEYLRSKREAAKQPSTSFRATLSAEAQAIIKAAAEAEARAIRAVMERERARGWRHFIKLVKPARMTAGEIKYVLRLAARANYPEANELLGYAYSVGVGSLKENQVKAYRQYGLAFSKGLVRVKPNLDLVWTKLTKDQQLTLLKEFEKASKVAKEKETEVKKK